jgi:hypothetical protein
VDPGVVDAGLVVYYNSYSGFAVSFAPTDNLSYSGAISVTYSDPIGSAFTIPLSGFASCLAVPQYTSFYTYAGGPDSGQTQLIPVANTCSATGVHLIGAPVLWNFLPDGGKTTDGPFQLAPGAPDAGMVLAAGATFDLPVEYAPTQLSYDTAEIELVTDEPAGGLTTIPIYGNGIGTSLYFEYNLDFTSSAGTTQTRYTYVVNGSGDYPPHVPMILGVGTNCPGMSAALQVPVPAQIPNGTGLELDATWTVPLCDGGECGCDGGYCNCSIYLDTSDIPPPHQTLLVYY